MSAEVDDSGDDSAPWRRADVVAAALEALRRPAFLVGPGNVVALANGAGLTLLEREQHRVLDAIRASEHDPADQGAFAITRLAPSACPGYFLAILKEARPSVSGRVVLARGEWDLSAQQARVLELIVTDAFTNKEIAQVLGCAEVTVENHVTELFRRAGAKSRTHLVGRLFTMSDGASDSSSGKGLGGEGAPFRSWLHEPWPIF